MFVSYRITVRLALQFTWFCLASLAASAPAQENLLVRVGEVWKYFKGTEEPPIDWNQPDFDDFEWLPGPSGIGYGDTDDATILGDMQNGYASYFARRTFDVPDARLVTNLTLRIFYDDGFVAYLNGEEVARSANMVAAGTPVDFAALASAEHEAATSEGFVIADPGIIQNGQNVLAIEVHNVTLGSSDASMIPELVVDADLCPKTMTCAYTSGVGAILNWVSGTTYDSIQVARGQEVLEEALDGALQTYTDPNPPSGQVTYRITATLRGETCAALQCSVVAFAPEDIVISPGEDWRFLRGSTAPPADWSAESFVDAAWEQGATGIGYGDNDDATILDDMQMVADDLLTPEDESQPGYEAIFARRDIQLASLAGVDGLILSIVFDDGFVAHVNGTEVGRINMLAGVVTNTTLAATAGEPGAPAQIIVPAGSLQVGRNLIAVSVHNAALTSTDLSFIPTVALLTTGGATGRFKRGDADGNGAVNITDAIFVLRRLFQGGSPFPCQDAADADDLGSVNITDAVFLLSSLFQGGGPLPAPGSSCGGDPSNDTLPACGNSSGC